MKSTYETMGGNYQPNGNYLMPDFEVPESPKVGVWGERRRKYLREHQQLSLSCAPFCGKSEDSWKEYLSFS